MVRFCYETDYDDERYVKNKGLGNTGNHSQKSVIVIINLDESDEIGYKQPHENLQSRSLVINAKLYILGDKYDIPVLMQVAARKYSEVVQQLRNSSAFA